MDVLPDFAFRSSGLEDVRLPGALRKIGERAFEYCKSLRGIALPDALEEIGFGAFWGSGLESFFAPASLRRIGDMAFRECRCLRDFRPNGGVRLGYLCLLGTGVADPGLRRTYLGTVWDSRELRLPQGLEAVGDAWFVGSCLERLFVSDSVRGLGTLAFSDCERLREVVLLFDYDQGNISNFRYLPDELGEDIRNGIQRIQTNAFDGCQNLSFFSFRDGSRLKRINAPAHAWFTEWKWRLSKGVSEKQDAEERQ